MLTILYRKYIPKTLREKIYTLFLKDVLFVYRFFIPLVRSKLTYYFFFAFPKTEKNQMYHFMGKYGLTPYPWEFVREYKKLADCSFDKRKALYYVMHNDKKLYFPTSQTPSQIQNLYNTLIIEQDIRSPHRYLKGDYSELKDRVLLDIGAAEGIFTLDSIEFVKHAYLFECDSNWINALHATFEPWKDKVTIIPKYVTNNDSGNETKIDSCQKYWNQSDLFIKMDIEGAELAALQGAKKVLTGNSDINMSVCTYHTPQDADKISSYLSTLGYLSYFTEGYLFFQKHFNKAVLRAEKKDNRI